MTVIEDTVGLPGITNLTVDSVAASLNQRYLIGSSDDFGELPKMSVVEAIVKHYKSLGIDWSHLSSTKQQVKVRNASKRKNGGDKKMFKRIKPLYPRDSPVRRKPLAAVNKQAAKVCIDMTVESPEFPPTST